MSRVRANSEKIRTIFERIRFELCHLMRNSLNANSGERENGFRLQKCCPCRTGAFDTHGYKFVSFLTCRYVPPLSLLPYRTCVYTFYSSILKQKPIMDAFFTLASASVYILWSLHTPSIGPGYKHRYHCIYNILLTGHILTFILLL